MDQLPGLIATFRDLDTFGWLIAAVAGNYFGVWVWGYAHRAEVSFWRQRAETAEEERLKLLRVGFSQRALLDVAE